jgi:ubiquinone/menaquinone biosynthesis C-methylase UbiE
VKGRLFVTGPKDGIEHYYRPGIGSILRRRFKWVLPLFPDQKVERILEVGYGSGVFQYELGRRCGLSVAVDPHPHASEVSRRLAEDGVLSTLVRGDGTRLPLQSKSFDLVIALSVIEHTSDPALCLAECRRVLRSGGRMLFLIPRKLAWADKVFQFLTGVDPEADFRGGRARAQEAILRVIPTCRRLRRPRLFPPFLAPYEVIVFDRP